MSVPENGDGQTFISPHIEQVAQIEPADQLLNAVVGVFNRNPDAVSTDELGHEKIYATAITGDHIELAHTHQESIEAGVRQTPISALRRAIQHRKSVHQQQPPMASTDVYTLLWTMPHHPDAVTRIELTREESPAISQLSTKGTFIQTRHDGTDKEFSITGRLLDDDVVTASIILDGSIGHTLNRNMEDRQRLPCTQIEGNEAMETWDRIAPAIQFALLFPEDRPLSNNDIAQPIIVRRFLDNPDYIGDLPIYLLDISAGQVTANGNGLISAAIVFLEDPFMARSLDSYFMVNIIRNVVHPDRTLVKYYFKHRTDSKEHDEPFALGPERRAQVQEAMAEQLKDPDKLRSEQPPERPDDYRDVIL